MIVVSGACVDLYPEFPLKHPDISSGQNSPEFAPVPKLPLPFGLYPNVSGSQLFWGWIVAGSEAYGALSFTGSTGHPYRSNTLSDETHYSSLGIDASKSNAIYGASNKVQPKATQLLIIIKT